MINKIVLSVFACLIFASLSFAEEQKVYTNDDLNWYKPSKERLNDHKATPYTLPNRISYFAVKDARDRIDSINQEINKLNFIKQDEMRKCHIPSGYTQAPIYRDDEWVGTVSIPPQNNTAAQLSCQASVATYYDNGILQYQKALQQAERDYQAIYKAYKEQEMIEEMIKNRAK